MRTIRLFSEQSLLEGSAINLTGGAADHLIRVLRVREGDAVTLFNGNGKDYRGSVISHGKSSVTVLLEAAESVMTEPPVFKELGLCISKGDRFSWAIQKTTELGVGSIVPLYSEKVKYRIPPGRITKRIAHWQAIVISACEQCGRAYVPKVEHPTSLTEWVRKTDADLKYVLHFGKRTQVISGTPPKKLALLIGPEGGLTEEEVGLAIYNHFIAIQLGPRVLTTETASVVALSILGEKWGDLGLEF